MQRDGFPGEISLRRSRGTFDKANDALRELMHVVGELMSKPLASHLQRPCSSSACLIWYGFGNTKGNHLAPTGSIAKVRTIKATDDVTFMVIDFKVKNDSDRDMVVRSVETAIDTADGGTVNGGGSGRFRRQ